MIAFTSDILTRVPVGGEGLSEDFEISGVAYKIYACGFGTAGSAARCFALVIMKSDHG